MASDPGIYAQAGKVATPLQNPMEVQQNALAVSNAMIQNKLAQAGIVRGQLAQQAIDPATGQFSPTAYNKLIGSTPDAAAGSMDAVQQSQGLMGQQNDLATKQNQYLSQTLGGILKLPDGQLHDGVLSGLNEAVSGGLITPETATRQALMLSNDPAALRQQLTQAQMRQMAAGPQRDATYGTTSRIDAGGQMLSGNTAPSDQGGGFRPSTATDLAPGPQFVQTGPGVIPTAGGVPTGGPLIRQTLTDAEKSIPTTIGMDNKGAATTGTRQQFLDKVGGGASPLGNGRYAPPSGSPLLNPNRPAPAASQQTGAANTVPQNAGIVSSMGPAQTAAASATGDMSAKAFQDIADKGVQAISQNAMLGNMLGDTSQFTSGTTGANTFKATIQRQAPAFASAFGISADKVAANESFDKLANQIVAAQQGTTSDARLAVSQHGNVSSGLSEAGVDEIIRQLQGNSDYQAARAKIGAAYPDKADRAGFESGPAQNLDPRAFQFDRLTPAQKANYALNLSPQDRSTVQNAYNYAHDQGLLTKSTAPTKPSSAAIPSRPIVPGY